MCVMFIYLYQAVITKYIEKEKPSYLELSSLVYWYNALSLRKLLAIRDIVGLPKNMEKISHEKFLEILMKAHLWVSYL